MMAPQSQMGVALSVLLDGILPVQAQEDRTISDIALNSRDVGPGTCFFALKGARANGMAFAAEAVARGAAAIVAEENEPALHFAIPVFEMANLRGYLGEIARRFFDDPSAAVHVFAITGTNGKSTVAHIAAQAVNEMGETGGYIGTLGAGRLDQLTTIGMTTPDIITLNRWLARLRGENVGFVALEASSHALDQDRLSGLTLGAAAFTNLGHDHLDYHGDIEAYAEIKQRLFSHKGLATAIVNVDDPVGARIASSIDPQVDLWTCSTNRSEGKGQARITGTEVEALHDGVRFTLRHANHTASIESTLPGRFNVDNLLIAAAYLLSLGHAHERICAALSRVRRVPGRMELCGTTPAGARVFVDYAHSPDSLLAALTALREAGAQRLILVFGCGGERDHSKRPAMGEIAECHADQVIVTADNPRGEQNADIAREIISGMQSPAAVSIIHDRAEAIRTAIEAASANDIVLLAGKGHEVIQEHDGVRTPFSDRLEVEQVLSENE